MPELAEPQSFVGADRVYHFSLINSPAALPGGIEFVLYTVTAPNFCIVRYLNAATVGAGGAGSYTWTLYGLYPFGVDQKFGYGGELCSACPVDIPAANTSRITWSTDVDTTYSNTDSNFGSIVQVPLPITYLPAGTVLSMLVTSKGGAIGGAYVDFAQLVVELVAPSALGIDVGSANADLYLLPNLG